MSRKIDNYTKFLNEMRYSVTNHDKLTITFMCDKLHQNNIKLTSFANKKAKWNHQESFCSICVKIDDNSLETSMNSRLEKLFTDHGCQLVSYDKTTRKVVYICKCGAENKSSDSIITKNDRKWSGCNKCQNIKNRNTIDSVTKQFEDAGYTVLPNQEYTCNKSKLTVLCCNNNCKKETLLSLSDLNRGRGCALCCKQRGGETCKEKYGHKNPFQVTQFKEKIKKTCLERYGETHHMKVKEIQEQSVKTNEEKHGIKYSFHTEESKQKGKATCVEKYGVEYPLQSTEIQKKIDETFTKLCGKNRPFGTDYHKQIILEKYGNDVYVCSDHFTEKMISLYGTKYFINSDECKRMMLEKYGSEYFINSDECKRMMLEKYGSEYFINSDECKRMMLEKYGSEYFINSDECKRMMLDKYGSEYFINSDECKRMMLDKYGSEYAMQCPELYRKADKSGLKRKTVDFEGKTYYVRGYEDICIKELNDSKMFKNIITDDDPNMPLIWYTYNDKQHLYYPDIYIQEKNIIIEVKSTYWYEKCKQIVLEKAKETSKHFKYILWLLEKRSDKRKLYKYEITTNEFVEIFTYDY